MVAIKGNTVFFILISIDPVITSQLSSDKVIIAKMYSMHICQIPGLVTKRLRKCVESNYT